MADFEFLIKLTEGKREVTITYCDYRLCHSNQQSVRDSDGSIPALGNEGNARAETRSAEDKRVKRMRSQGCGCSTLLQGLALVLGVVGQSRRAAARNRLQTPALTITYRAKQAIKHVARAHLRASSWVATAKPPARSPRRRQSTTWT
jgi:hypothetical protein